MSDEAEDPALSFQEKEMIYDYINRNASAPVPEDKFNVHMFLHRVATEKDTTKVGFLSAEELGTAKHPIRALKEFALIASDIMEDQFMSDYFAKEAEILTSTSLSRDGFLVKQATVQARKISDVTKIKKENKGWFKKNSEEKNEPKED